MKPPTRSPLLFWPTVITVCCTIGIASPCPARAQDGGPLPEQIVAPKLTDETPTAAALIQATSPGVAASLSEDVASVYVLDECLVAQTCIDRFLWALYQRTPKVDQVEHFELREVTITRHGRSRTVTKFVGQLVDRDFAWKDIKAADKVHMTLQDFVIGGMDRSFKSKLFQLLNMAEQAGLSPGITSGFRDDYRQSIASGLKAANSRSYHGGSAHGGHGHGLAADVICIEGKDLSDQLAASEILWRWIDQHGKEFGIGRPYMNRDRPHLAPIDGVEYAHHRGVARHFASSRTRIRKRIAAAHDHRMFRRTKAVRSSRA
jgi:hypothetical protein